MIVLICNTQDLICNTQEKRLSKRTDVPIDTTRLEYDPQIMMYGS